ncbi:hypothetical protein B0H14DRAFT_3662997 [Mycena olivaceomarginata]|nr:hypothetical protein B0H14DRAFT_3662997 [Mycena olivaceomarginata]
MKHRNSMRGNSPQSEMRPQNGRSEQIGSIEYSHHLRQTAISRASTNFTLTPTTAKSKKPEFDDETSLRRQQKLAGARIRAATEGEAGRGRKSGRKKKLGALRIANRREDSAALVRAIKEATLPSQSHHRPSSLLLLGLNQVLPVNCLSRAPDSNFTFAHALNSPPSLQSHPPLSHFIFSPGRPDHHNEALNDCTYTSYPNPVPNLARTTHISPWSSVARKLNLLTSIKNIRNRVFLSDVALRGVDFVSWLAPKYQQVRSSCSREEAISGVRSQQPASWTRFGWICPGCLDVRDRLEVGIEVA